MYARLFLALVVVAAFGSSSVGRVSEAREDPVGRAREVLEAKAQGLSLRPDLSDLSVVGVKAGLAADYVRFQQTFKGVPVAGAEVVVALPWDPAARPIVSSSYQPGPRLGRAVASAPADRQIAAASAVDVALESVRASPDQLSRQPLVQSTYFLLPDGPTLAWRVELHRSKPFGGWSVYVDAQTAKPLSVSQLVLHSEGQVFDPSPARSPSGPTVGAGFPPNCASAANEETLSSQYVIRELQGIQEGQSKLKGEFVDLTAPDFAGYKPAGQAEGPDYVFPCNDDRFEEANIYYHVDTAQRKIQSLGFTGPRAILDQPIPAHAHHSEVCNASGGPTGIAFGDCNGEFDFAEDPDIIVHEYAHALQFSQLGIISLGSQAVAFYEGFADFAAAAVFGDPCFAEWYAWRHVTEGCLRQLEVTGLSGQPVRYPEDYTACSGPHCQGQIWSGAMWDLVRGFRQQLGDQAARDTALALALESHNLLTSSSSAFVAAAVAVRKADQLLYGGAHVPFMNQVFVARGIFVDSDVDGVLDVDDNCPALPNPLQENQVHPQTPLGDRCEDPDADSRADIADNCPDVFNPLQENQVHPQTPLGDRCEDPDGDSIADIVDNCPDHSNPSQQDAVHPDSYGDHCDDPDSDLVFDATDNCPDKPNPLQENQAHSQTPLGDHCEDPDGDSLFDISDNCPDVVNPDQDDVDGDNTGDACDAADTDSDLSADAVEYHCASAPGDPDSVPERLDSAFSGADDDGDTQVDEPLPPSGAKYDCDGDGYTGSVEFYVFAAAAGRDQDPCGTDAWPADIVSTGSSANKVTMEDLATFISPVRRLDSSPGDPAYDSRWDLVPGPHASLKHISLEDMDSAILLTPPMLGGVRALDGPECGTPGDADDDAIHDSIDNCPGRTNPDQGDANGNGTGDACDGADSDGDRRSDEAEYHCGSRPGDAGSLPERIDGAFAGVDDDGDTEVDEALPPSSMEFDCDGDGYAGSAESHVFAEATGRDQDPCGSDAWPADIVSGLFSANRVDMEDIASAVAPMRHLNSSPGDPGYDARWDVAPGSLAGPSINVEDLTTVTRLEPPMLNGAGPAFNGPACPWPP